MALALGILDVRKLLRTIPMDMFVYWVVFLNRQKLKHTKQDYQLATITKAVWEHDSTHRGDLKDYLIEFKTEEQLRAEQEEADMQFMRYMASLPGAIVEEITE